MSTWAASSYLVVLVVLVVLTFLTVGVSFIPLDPQWHFSIGIGIAACKATFVVLFFMHLVHSRATVWSVVCVSLFWAVIVLGALTFSDYATRAWPPFVPGH